MTAGLKVQKLQCREDKNIFAGVISRLEQSLAAQISLHSQNALSAYVQQLEGSLKLCNPAAPKAPQASNPTGGLLNVTPPNAMDGAANLCQQEAALTPSAEAAPAASGEVIPPESGHALADASQLGPTPPCDKGECLQAQQPSVSPVANPILASTPGAEPSGGMHSPLNQGAVSGEDADQQDAQGTRQLQGPPTSGASLRPDADQGQLQAPQFLAEMQSPLSPGTASQAAADTVAPRADQVASAMPVLDLLSLDTNAQAQPRLSLNMLPAARLESATAQDEACFPSSMPNCACLTLPRDLAPSHDAVPKPSSHSQSSGSLQPYHLAEKALIFSQTEDSSRLAAMRHCASAGTDIHKCRAGQQALAISEAPSTVPMPMPKLTEGRGVLDDAGEFMADADEDMMRLESSREAGPASLGEIVHAPVKHNKAAPAVLATSDRDVADDHQHPACCAGDRTSTMQPSMASMETEPTAFHGPSKLSALLGKERCDTAAAAAASLPMPIKLECPLGSNAAQVHAGMAANTSAAASAANEEKQAPMYAAPTASTPAVIQPPNAADASTPEDGAGMLRAAEEPAVDAAGCSRMAGEKHESSRESSEAAGVAAPDLGSVTAGFDGFGGRQEDKTGILAGEAANGDAIENGKIIRDPARELATAAAAATAAESSERAAAGPLPWPLYLIGTRDCFTNHLVPITEQVWLPTATDCYANVFHICHSCIVGSWEYSTVQ